MSEGGAVGGLARLHQHEVTFLGHLVEFLRFSLGEGEGYLAKSFDKGSSDIRMIGCVDPKNVNWVVTLSRNMYTLRDEKEIFINNGKPIEIDSIQIENEQTSRGHEFHESGKNMLQNPIIVKA